MANAPPQHVVSLPRNVHHSGVVVSVQALQPAHQLVPLHSHAVYGQLQIADGVAL